MKKYLKKIYVNFTTKRMVALAITHIVFNCYRESNKHYTPNLISISNYLQLYSDLLQLHCIKISSVGFLKNRLILFFINLGRYQHLVDKYCVTSVQMKRDCIDN